MNKVAEEKRAERVAFRVEKRPWHSGYEDGSERLGEAFRSIREELGFESAEEMHEWVWRATGGEDSSANGVDIPPPLIECVEWNAIGWETSMYVIDGIAQALGVSPGTLLDELWLRASMKTPEGWCEDADHDWSDWSYVSNQAGTRHCKECGKVVHG